ncbi:MAG: acyl carrier protein [Clostridiaceae bacterium]|nr:acyl carrier protein [Clostridiaceae bacterium]
MDIKEKLNILEELLDLEKDSLDTDTVLDEISEWDSIAVISTIAMFDSLFGKEITAREVNGFKTVKDIIDRME